MLFDLYTVLPDWAMRWPSLQPIAVAKRVK